MPGLGGFSCFMAVKRKDMFNYKIFKNLTFEERQAYISRIQDVAESHYEKACSCMFKAHDKDYIQDQLNLKNELESKLNEWVYWSNR